MHTHSKLGHARALAAGAALVAGLVAAPAAHAQDRPERGERQEQGQRATPRERLDRRVAMLTERLSLNADQATRIRAVLEEQGAEMQRLREARGGQDRAQRPEGGGRGEGMAEARASQQRYETRIEAVLTESQRAAYTELRESQRRRSGGREGGPARQAQPRTR